MDNVIVIIVNVDTPDTHEQPSLDSLRFAWQKRANSLLLEENVDADGILSRATDVQVSVA